MTTNMRHVLLIKTLPLKNNASAGINLFVCYLCLLFIEIVYLFVTCCLCLFCCSFTTFTFMSS